MTLSDRDQVRVVQLLIKDLHATVGAGHDHLAQINALRLRAFVDNVDSYLQHVVDGTQQQIHDEFLDTAWPRCPRHAHHPLWFRDGAWWCGGDNVRVAQLGELESVVPLPG
jgi:hypothetical protein